jgi:copper(I)-binding protein
MKTKRRRMRRMLRNVISDYRNCMWPILLVLVCLSHVSADDSIIVRDAWMLEAPPNARVIAGYMTIENKTAKSRTLINVSSDKFKRIEVHRTEMHGDVMRMVPQEKLEIPAKGEVSLKPGNYHLMLIGPESVPKEGEVVNLELQFDNGYTKNINLTVRAAKRGRINR